MTTTVPDMAMGDGHLTIVEGTSEIQRVGIAKRILKEMAA